MSGESAVSVHVIDVLLMDRTCKKGWMHSVLFVRSTVARMKEVLKYNDGSLGGELQRELARWQQRAESQRIRSQWIGSHKCAHGTGLAHKCPLALIVRRDPSWQVELHKYFLLRTAKFCRSRVPWLAPASGCCASIRLYIAHWRNCAGTSDRVQFCRCFGSSVQNRSNVPAEMFLQQ